MTKAEMIEKLNGIFSSFYGANTVLHSSVCRLPKAAIAQLYEVYWLNYVAGDETIGDTVRLLESWILCLKEMYV